MPQIKCQCCNAAIEFEVDLTLRDYDVSVYGVEAPAGEDKTTLESDERNARAKALVLLEDGYSLGQAEAMGESAAVIRAMIEVQS